MMESLIKRNCQKPYIISGDTLFSTFGVYGYARIMKEASHMLGLRPERYIGCGSWERERLSLIDFDTSLYASFVLLCGLVVSLAYFIIFLPVSFFLDVPVYFSLFSIPLFPLGVLFGKLIIRSLISESERKLEEDVLSSLSHLLAEMRGGVSLLDALRHVSKGDHGIVSKVLDEALLHFESGLSLQESISVSSRRFRSNSLLEFMNILSFNIEKGRRGEDMLLSLRERIRENVKKCTLLKSSRMTSYATYLVMLTGVLPGMVLFGAVQGALLFHKRLGVDFLFLLFIVFFPSLKILLSLLINR